MSSNTTKNYTAQGGSLTVIGGELQILGKLTIEPGAEVVGLGSAVAPAKVEQTMTASFIPAEAQPDSTATTTAALREDFNALLGKLRAIGILSRDAP